MGAFVGNTNHTTTFSGSPARGLKKRPKSDSERQISASAATIRLRILVYALRALFCRNKNLLVRNSATRKAEFVDDFGVSGRRKTDVLQGSIAPKAPQNQSCGRVRAVLSGLCKRFLGTLGEMM